MRKMFRKMLSFLLVISMMVGMTITASAEEKEEYLSELRIVYADSYDKAEEILKDSEFADYKIYDYNLNNKTGKDGVYLAYKTTTDIEEAITDISVMQMGGGYQEGNYQEMLEQSYQAYVEQGKYYQSAINYFSDSYNAGHYLTECAYRQLNFYCDNERHDGELLGNLIMERLDEDELAQMFMQGNVYVMKNVRSLLAQGVSYNASGETYLELVAKAAAKMNKDEDVFADEDYEELAIFVSITFSTFRDMFEELECYEDELDYTDEEYTDEELKYAEYKMIADMLRGVEYLNGQTLYEFCMEYEVDEKDYSAYYPLVHALNAGQKELTRLSHYYDVVRYSMSEVSEEMMEEEISELEAIYKEEPFDIYTGVDLGIYEGTYALTTEAYRADVSSEVGLKEYLLDGHSVYGTAGAIIGGVGVGTLIFAITRTVVQGISKVKAASVAKAAAATAQAKQAAALNTIANASVGKGSAGLVFKMATGEYVHYNTHSEFINLFITKHGISTAGLPQNATFADQYNLVMSKVNQLRLDKTDMIGLNSTKAHATQAQAGVTTQSGQQAADVSTQAATTAGGPLTGIMYFASGVLLVTAAVVMGIGVYNYYHPEYDDVPTTLVDMVQTEDGDRYIKYDVAYEVTPQDDGSYNPGDLNAYAAKRWNALYYTKSYEAGKPLLAEFEVSTDSNTAEEGFLPIHRFGEVICYNLNKYNFDSDSETIYVSVKQSENQKAAVADVPEVVGTMVSYRNVFLSAGLGLIVGVIGMMFVQKSMNAKKKSEEE